MEFTFTLKYQLSAQDVSPDDIIGRLVAAGCDDALIGIGLPGRVALEFSREADSAAVAIGQALADAENALPAATLIEASPDLVGLTDVAELVGVSRQNMRKLMLSYPGDFPSPVHEGKTSLWHLADILGWLQPRGGYPLDPAIIEVSLATLQVNINKEARRLAQTALPAGSSMTG